MMKQRKYYYLEEAERESGIPVEDLIHWGETCQVQLYVMAYGGGQGRVLAEVGDRLVVRATTVYPNGLFPVYQQSILHIKHNAPTETLFMSTKKEDGRRFVFDKPFLFTVDDLVIKAEDLETLRDAGNRELGSKERENLYRIIGGFMKILDYDKRFSKGTGVNKSAIENRFLKELADKGYTAEGFKSFRKSVGPAFEAIENNKMNTEEG